MKHLRRFAVLGLTLALAGCGTDLGQRVTLADARAVCVAGHGSVNAITNFTTWVLFAEALRDDGLPESAFIAIAVSECEPNEVVCFSCFTHLAAAVWN